ncbi:MAG: GNAT family N-acetyltransferase, partial [Thermoplasmata archaeon]|nr:GNAT family N-acetyltransferase [Thermoplasmata archaeon]
MKPVCKVIQTSEEMDMARSIRMGVFVKGQDVPISIEMDEYDEIATHVICQYGDKFIGTGRLVQHGNQVKLGR